MTLFQPRRGILALVLLTLSPFLVMAQKITPPSVIIGPFTVSTLPTSVANTLTTITDGTSTSDCTIGGGSSFVLCRYSGSAWSAIGGGSMVYPGSGIANSTGSAWGTSYGTSGSGSVCLTVSCTMTTPALGIPSALVLTNATGLPNASVIGLGTAALQANSFFLQTANNLSDVTAATARTNLGLGTAATQSTGTSGGTVGLLNGTLTFSGTNAYGTPASIILTNATGLPNTAVIGLGTAALQNTGTSGANLGLLNGTLTFSGANAYGTPASIVLTNATGLPNASVIGLGTAALQNTGTSGANIGLLNGTLTFSGANAYGTPASIVLTNASGLPASALPSTFSIAGPITLSGSAAGTALFGCASQTIPVSPANAVGIIGPSSCTGQHVYSPPATGATGSTQVLTAGGAESGGITPTQWATPPSAYITSLTTTGSSGAASVSSGVLNIPQYTGSGGSSFPLTIVQEMETGSTSNGTSYAITFPQATASSGNTAFMIVSSDASATMTFPSGWTVDFDQTQSTYARLTLLHKTTASDTSATFGSTSAGTGYAVYFFEVSGSHALDQKSTGGQAGSGTVGMMVTLPSITPTVGSVVFGMIGSVAAGPGSSTVVGSGGIPINPIWRPLFDQCYSAAARFSFGYMSIVPATGSAITPPPINALGLTFTSGAGAAYATFSIL